MSKLRLVVFSLIVLLAISGYGVQLAWQRNIDLARQHFIDSSHAATMEDMHSLETAVRSIYENLRTLSLLPSVRDIDRHGESMTPEGRVTFQQVYNNLANSVAVSEVYIVPIDLNPERIDPVTLKTEVPNLMFDQLIVHPEAYPNSAASGKDPSTNATAAALTSNLIEDETFEYRQFVKTASWLKQHYPTADTIKGLEVPFLAGSEVITCDNTRYVKTLKDPDRSGILFVVPFYGQDGQIRGMISATILSKALAELFPAENIALVNPGNGYVNAAAGVAQSGGSAEFASQAKVDPNLIYSEVVPFTVKDARNPWYLWAGLPDEKFYQSADVVLADQTRRNNFLILIIFGLAAATCIALVQRNLRQANALANSLRISTKIAQKSEAEATDAADLFKMLNDDIVRLNSELAVRLKELTEAQDEIVKKGQMAQLGNLIATVAHELRNPLGSVRTTVFMLERKLKDSPADVGPQLKRIEQGIERCDSIITQLLDFSRSVPLHTAPVEMTAWLQNLLEEEAPHLDNRIELEYCVGSSSLEASIEAGRLRRGVVNLLENAAQALTDAMKHDATMTNPRIIVSLRQVSRGCEIEVSDNGPGIPPEILTKIGEPLFTTKSFGTGLGVAAVRKVAELHGGGLDITSQLGAGASFTLWIPQQQARSTRTLTGSSKF